MGSHQTSQRGVEQMGGSVVFLSRQPSRHIHFGFDSVSDLHIASETLGLVCRAARNHRVSVVNQSFGVVAFQYARVANLTTSFSIELCLVEKDLRGFASLQLLNMLALRENGYDSCIGHFKIGVSHELGLLIARSHNRRSRSRSRFLPACFATLTLGFELLIEAFLV